MKKIFLNLLIGLIVSCNLVMAQRFKDFSSLPKTKWKLKYGAIFGSPVISDGLVYFTSADSALHAVDLQKGAEKWKFGFYASCRSTPAIDKDNIYVIAEDGLLYNINKHTGKLNWQFVTPQGTLTERKYDLADYYQSSPLVDGERIYFGMGDYLYTVDAKTGKLLWNFKTGNLVHTKPTIANDKVIFGSYDGNVYALSSTTGTLVWKFKTVGQRFFPNGEVMGNPVASRNQVFIGARDFNFYAIENNTGYCHWNKQFPKGWALSATMLKDSVLYLGTSDDYVMIALDPRMGKELWRTAVKYNIFGGMALSESMGYVGTLMGKVFGLDLKTGAIKWEFDGDGYKKNKDKYFNKEDKHPDSVLPSLGNFQNVIAMYNKLGAVFSTPAVSNDYIVFTSADGAVYCLER